MLLVGMHFLCYLLIPIIEPSVRLIDLPYHMLLESYGCTQFRTSLFLFYLFVKQYPNIRTHYLLYIDNHYASI